MKTKILLDTDIGSDIDDALALAYLLKQPNCELLGVTTVTGQPEKRAALASAICHAMNRLDVPIHVGASEPLFVTQRQTQATQAEMLSDFPHQTFAPDNTAIEFLRATIRAHPGEITLLTIGPLTNIALLFQLDPEIPRLLKGLVMMGGRFYSKSPEGFVVEWNMLCDPHAAAKVFASPVPQLTAVGLDVTNQCRLEVDECERHFGELKPAFAPVAAMAKVWLRGAPHVIFHDPLAAALIFEPSLCEVAPHHIEVDVLNPPTMGHTYHLYDQQTKPHHVAQSVDSAAFFEHYFRILAA